ncbi:hypothetical protein [uncultured Nitrospira sp.]|uniref:hypothetical protein n=1 Tax=uncultured Nitrospira sp. TaxID=157176 RepID=UPI003140AAD9
MDSVKEEQSDHREIRKILNFFTVLDCASTTHGPSHASSPQPMESDQDFFLSPTQPHDANLRIENEEFPSGKVQILEQATAIRYQMPLVHDHLGEIFTYEFDAQPNASAFGSLYWNTIGNLEEDLFYCFVEDLIREQVHRGQDEEETLLEVLMRPFGQQQFCRRSRPSLGTRPTTRQDQYHPATRARAVSYT